MREDIVSCLLSPEYTAVTAFRDLGTHKHH